MRARKTALGLIVVAGVVQGAEPVKDVESSQLERQALMLTVYADDLALVREQRRIELAAGRTRLALRDVAVHLRPESAMVHAAGAGGFRVIEQQFDYELLTTQKLLEKNVGREVTVLRPNPSTGEDRRERATLLSVAEGPVLRFADRIESAAAGRIAFDGIPPGLHDRPTLSVLLDATAGGKQTVELTYLTGAMSWKADYVASLAPDGRSLELDGWATLVNRSGAAFDNASLRLVAGSVHRARAPSPARELAATEFAAMRAAPSEPAAEALGDVYLYRFDQPVSIAENQTKLLALLSAHQVPVHREYVLAGAEWMFRDKVRTASQKQRPATIMSFENKGSELGRPLPAGIVRVYARDSAGALQFIGEDRMEHTAKNETVKLDVGEAFDITAERTQSAFRRVAKNVVESNWRIELHNAKEEAVTVKVLEPMPDDWEIVQESLPHSKESAHRAQWQVQVPAGGAAILEYVVRVTS